MRDLFPADLIRLRRSPGLWLSGLLAIGYMGLMLQSWYGNNQLFIEINLTEEIRHTEWFLFSHTNNLRYLIALFAALYLWGEFSSGGVRNKLVRGASRRDVYFSHLLAVFLGGAIVCVVPTVVCLDVGLPLYGPITAGPGIVLATFLGTICATLALCALDTAIITLLQGGPTAILPCIALAWADGAAAGRIESYLEDCTAAGTAGPWYGLCRFLYDVLPAGQMLQYSTLKARDFLLMISSALVLAILSAAAGVLLFRRQELR